MQENNQLTVGQSILRVAKDLEVEYQAAMDLIAESILDLTDEEAFIEVRSVGESPEALAEDTRRILREAARNVHGSEPAAGRNAVEEVPREGLSNREEPPAETWQVTRCEDFDEWFSRAVAEPFSQVYSAYYVNHTMEGLDDEVDDGFRNKVLAIKAAIRERVRQRAKELSSAMQRQASAASDESSARRV